jgi:hypothetical protein
MYVCTTTVSPEVLATQLEPGPKAIPFPPKTIVQNVRRSLQAFLAAFFGSQTGLVVKQALQQKGTMFSFFKSYYVDDTAYILLSRGEVVAASKLIVSHFRRFGLTIHTGSTKRKKVKNGGHSLSKAWTGIID